MVSTVTTSRSAAIIAALLLAAACGADRITDPSHPYVVETDARTYRSGDTVTVVARNVSGVTLEVGTCGYRLQRREGTSWQVTHEVRR